MGSRVVRCRRRDEGDILLLEEWGAVRGRRAEKGEGGDLYKACVGLSG
jgi:hypothetical protein